MYKCAGVVYNYFMTKPQTSEDQLVDHLVHRRQMGASVHTSIEEGDFEGMDLLDALDLLNIAITRLARL